MKKFLFALLMAGSAFGVNPASTIPTSDFAFSVNRWMGPTAYNQSLGTRVFRAHTVGYGTLDFSKQSGANGDVTVGLLLPAKAILRRVFFDVVTAVSPVGTSIAFNLLTSEDIKAATAAASWSGQVTGIQDGTTTHMLKTTSATNVVATLSGSTATAGKIRVFADYVVSE